MQISDGLVCLSLDDAFAMFSLNPQSFGGSSKFIFDSFVEKSQQIQIDQQSLSKLPQFHNSRYIHFSLIILLRSRIIAILTLDFDLPLIAAVPVRKLTVLLGGNRMSRRLDIAVNMNELVAVLEEVRKMLENVRCTIAFICAVEVL